MALHSDFPSSPFDILKPEVRWFPADEALREISMEKLMPPLVAQLRNKVKDFRDSGYVNASDTSRSLLNWRFKGQKGLDVEPKMRRLRQWCEDINTMQSKIKYDFVYVDQESFEKYKPKSFNDLLTAFRDYRGEKQ